MILLVSQPPEWAFVVVIVSIFVLLGLIYYGE